MTTEKSPRNVIEEFVAAVNAQDWRTIAALIAPDFRHHGAGAGPPALAGREALLDFLRQEFTAFPDARETIEDILCEGNKLAVRHPFTGTQSGPWGELLPSGKRATADYIAIYGIEDGIIVEAWVAWDNLGILHQLGQTK